MHAAQEKAFFRLAIQAAFNSNIVLSICTPKSGLTSRSESEPIIQTCWASGFVLQSSFQMVKADLFELPQEFSYVSRYQKGSQPRADSIPILQEQHSLVRDSGDQLVSESRLRLAGVQAVKENRQISMVAKEAHQTASAFAQPNFRPKAIIWKSLLCFQNPLTPACKNSFSDLQKRVGRIFAALKSKSATSLAMLSSVAFFAFVLGLILGRLSKRPEAQSYALREPSKPALECEPDYLGSPHVPYDEDSKDKNTLSTVSPRTSKAVRKVHDSGRALSNSHSSRSVLIKIINM